MKIVGYSMFYNESSRGNMGRCLEHMARYCDAIVLFDDGSTDDSREVASQYTDHIIGCSRNDFLAETLHRQRLLDLAGTLEPDYIFWLDMDEQLCAPGEQGGLRALCERNLKRGPTWASLSYEFEEVTLWRSQSWRRMDYLGRGWFTRLWAWRPGLRIPQVRGLHKQLYPDGLDVHAAPFRVLHYGYSTREAIERRWRERTELGVPKSIRARGINESRMELERVPPNWFPPGCEPPADEPAPTPITYEVS